MVVAETVVDARYSKALNVGFRRLAGYIFGNNVRSERLEMTAPVEAQRSGERFAMAAPVQAQAVGERWRISFVMPPGRTLDDLPAPKDPALKLRALPARTVAALGFWGFATERAVSKRARQLIDWLVAHDLEPAGEPVIAQHDPPWRLPFRRRNEILIDLVER